MIEQSLENILVEFKRTRDWPLWVGYFLKNTKQIPDLTAYSLQESNGKLGEYGSWLCMHLAEKLPGVFNKDTSKIISLLQESSNQSFLRNWMKILSLSEWDEEYDGIILQMALDHISDGSNKVALQVYSMYVILPILEKEPLLIDECIQLIELHSQEKTPAYHSAFRHFQKICKKY